MIIDDTSIFYYDVYGDFTSLQRFLKIILEISFEGVINFKICIIYLYLILHPFTLPTSFIIKSKFLASLDKKTQIRKSFFIFCLSQKR